MKIRAVFHKPKRWDLLGQGIRFWTGLISKKNRTVGPYDHVELWTSDARGIFIGVDHLFKTETVYGTLWTSTRRPPANGTVKRPASEVIHNPARWDYCEVEIDDSDYETVVRWMDLEVKNNAGYGIFDFAKFFGLGWLIKDKKRNICSEFVLNALWRIAILAIFGVISPRRLAYLLVQAGYKIKSLQKGGVI